MNGQRLIDRLPLVCRVVLSIFSPKPRHHLAHGKFQFSLCAARTKVFHHQLTKCLALGCRAAVIGEKPTVKWIVQLSRKRVVKLALCKYRFKAPSRIDRSVFEQPVRNLRIKLVGINGRHAVLTQNGELASHQRVKILTNLASRTEGNDNLPHVATSEKESRPGEAEREALQVDQTRSQLDQEVGKEGAAIAATGTTSRAALAADEAQSALATVRQHVDRHVRLRLAGEVLCRHIERYREQDQDPVIKRAGDISPRLTVGSFARLKTGFDDKDRPVLLGFRPSGEEVDMAGMTDGTRDQLFLALRLASLERPMLASGPLPFVVDDILVNFDDGRAQATLEALAEVAQRTRVLFFTHHTRLVELAKSAIPGGLLKVNPLST